jgi:hypothetical protein
LSSDMEISKSGSDIDISGNGGNEAAPTTRATNAGEPDGHVLLRPPIIEDMGQIATGATSNKL